MDQLKKPATVSEKLLGNNTDTFMDLLVFALMG